jgi:prephenate dehydrogenase
MSATQPNDAMPCNAVSTEPMRVLVSGLGLMGASAAAAALAAGHQVFLHHRREDPVRQAVERGFGQAWQGEADLDLIVVGAPVAAVSGIAADFAARIPSVPLCDMGSTKLSVCAAIAAHAVSAEYGGQADLASRFVGAHPMCGSHHQGLAHADPSMFRDASCVLTPAATSAPAAIAAVHAFWQSLGCVLHTLTPAEHDAAVARASHVPHILAAATAKQLRGPGVPLAAGGFRDTSRVAAGDPELWHGILSSNTDEIVAVLSEVLADLTTLRDDLQRGSRDGVLEYLQDACDRRGLFEAVRLAALRKKSGEVSYFRDDSNDHLEQGVDL